jgi:hypothetical protein
MNSEELKLTLGALDTFIPRLYDVLQLHRQHIPEATLLALTTALKKAWDIEPKRVGEDADRLGLHSYDITDEAVAIALQAKSTALKAAAVFFTNKVFDDRWYDILVAWRNITEIIEDPANSEMLGRIAASESEDDILADDDGQADVALAGEVTGDEEVCVFGQTRALRIQDEVARGIFQRDPYTAVEPGGQCRCVTGFGMAGHVPDRWVVVWYASDGAMGAYTLCPLCHGTGKVV